jgi:RNA polymerase sigma-70 factor (ECF subfamily)
VLLLGTAFDDVLAAARTGAGWACASLYEDLAGVVTGYLRRQGAAEPDDVASETFLHVFRSLHDFHGDEEGFRSWVFTIAHRRLVDERRRRSARPVTAPLALAGQRRAEGSVEDEVVAAEGLQRFGDVLTVLSRAQRDVVLLRVVAGLSVDETADVVGRSQGAVRQLQRRGLQALASELELRGPDTSS